MISSNHCFVKYNLSNIAAGLGKYLLVFLLAALIFIVAVFETNNTNNTNLIVVASPSPEVSIQPAAAPEQTPPNQPDERFKYLGWWGDINYGKAGVFAEPTSTSKKLGTFTKINRVKVLEEVVGEKVGENNLWYKIDGGMYPGAYVFAVDVTPVTEPMPPIKPKIPATVKEGDYWVDVDLTKKVLSLFLYDQPIFATYVATGVIGHLTPTGTYRIWYKLEKTRMTGRPPVAAKVYDLPNVPYVMFYRGSFSLHGTYWHDKFGTRQSSGCTNLTQGDAKFIFDKVNPIIPETAKLVLSTSANPGTVVYNHY